MKSFIIIILLLLNAAWLQAQTIDFSSYDRVTDPQFRSFLSLFSKKELPISADQMVALNIWGLTRNPLSQALIDKYLMDEGELITGPLYIEKPADDQPDQPREGTFYPLYKLPTNGNYVLLAFAQVADPADIECSGLVVVLSYDLNGTFLYLSNYTYDPGSEKTNAYIDETLKSHLIYVYNEVDGELVFPPTDKVFTSVEGHLVYQINPNGKSTRLSFEKTTAQFKFSPEECRFKRVN